MYPCSHPERKKYIKRTQWHYHFSTPIDARIANVKKIKVSIDNL